MTAGVTTAEPSGATPPENVGVPGTWTGWTGGTRAAGGLEDGFHAGVDGEALVPCRAAGGLEDGFHAGVDGEALVNGGLDTKVLGTIPVGLFGLEAFETVLPAMPAKIDIASLTDVFWGATSSSSSLSMSGLLLMGCELSACFRADSTIEAISALSALLARWFMDSTALVFLFLTTSS